MPAGFGIASFHFAVSDAQGGKLTRDQYVATVRAALEGCHAINNVSMNHPDDSWEIEWDVNPPPSWSNGQLVPDPGFLDIKFDLYIPKRVQDGILSTIGFGRPGSENFVVRCHYTPDAPVALVQPIEPEEGFDPSTAVVVAREYLEAELQRAGSRVALQTLGPSPMHVDCYLEGIDGELDDGFKVECVADVGYDKLLFTYQRSAFVSEPEAIEHIFREIELELGLCYAYRAADSRSLDDWISLYNALQELVSRPEGALFRRIAAALRRRQRIGAVFADLARFEIGRLMDESDLEKGYRDFCAVRRRNLATLIEKVRADRHLFPTAQMDKLVGYLDQQHARSNETIAILIAAVLGGVAGAAFTLMVQ